ncbi:hypothetical protein PCC7418_1656 [Halothece sp. PCC 7418]|uniref:HNH endonuclease n=1 Tax=Halothece sp. (strain PCC 7418) TaxID=65093 RepID=UPI0002A07E92|nr:HNH endonuclease [Halothece sp. PCC 7418]AFZ43836.1 hypothetical protein PCC7418_1656 [Halothece sp. PCC 7418]
MKECIYCRKTKNKSDFSLEHIIPYSLGGSQLPDNLKSYDVCQRCNNILGLFVDGAFEKNFFVHNFLIECDLALLNQSKYYAEPLSCLGKSKLSPPEIKEEEICEYWIGTLGLGVFWIRPDDSRFEAYCGGDPIKVKSKKIDTRAYFVLPHSYSESSDNANKLLMTIKEAFRDKPVKKVLCHDFDKESDAAYVLLEQLGFSEPDQLDEKRKNYFHSIVKNGEIENNLQHDLYHDKRFLAKVSIGISHCLFGDKILNTESINKLYKVLWDRDNSEDAELLYNNTFLCNRTFYYSHYSLEYLLGVPYAVTISIIPDNQYIIININIKQELNYVVGCAKINDITQKELESITNNGGEVFVIYKKIDKCIHLYFNDFILHQNGSKINPQIDSIQQRINENNYTSDKKP